MGRAMRLNGVARYKDAQERQAAETLGAANQQLHAQQETLTTLGDHRASYRKLLYRSHQAGISATTWKQNLNFLNALDDAIDSQHHNVELYRQTSDQARQQWHHRHREHQAIAKLKDRLAQDEQRLESIAESQQATESWVARNPKGRNTSEHE